MDNFSNMCLYFGIIIIVLVVAANIGLYLLDKLVKERYCTLCREEIDDKCTRKNAKK